MIETEYVTISIETYKKLLINNTIDATISVTILVLLLLVILIALAFVDIERVRLNRYIRETEQLQEYEDWRHKKWRTRTYT